MKSVQFKPVASTLSTYSSDEYNRKGVPVSSVSISCQFQKKKELKPSLFQKVTSFCSFLAKVFQIVVSHIGAEEHTRNGNFLFVSGKEPREFRKIAMIV